MVNILLILFLPIFLRAEIQEPIGFQGEKGQLMGPFNYAVEDDMLHLDKAIGSVRTKKDVQEASATEDIDEEF